MKCRLRGSGLGAVQRKTLAGREHNSAKARGFWTYTLCSRLAGLALSLSALRSVLICLQGR